VELRLPSPVPIPGVKLGLANIITVVAVYRFRASEVSLLLAVRIILGAIFAGNLSALLFSACGAVLCLCGMLLLKKFLPKKYIPLCSVIGAMLHNVGQMAAAVWIMGSAGVLVYLPILIVTGGIAGLFTGLCAAAVERRLHHVIDL
jgi:heptaprenyl diphosphate synthase